MPTMQAPVARTPLHHWHAAHGAAFVAQDGWQVVRHYGSAEREVSAARAGLGLVDVSARAKVSLRGSGAPDLARYLIGEGPETGPRRVAAIPALSALACLLTETHLLLLGSSTSLELGGRLDGRPVACTDATSALAAFWVLGPRCEEFLARLTQLDVRAARFPISSCAETAVAGVEGLLVRPAELSLPSMRVCVPWDLGEFVWERMMEAGRAWGVAPVGMEALASLDATGP